MAVEHIVTSHMARDVAFDASDPVTITSTTAGSLLILLAYYFQSAGGVITSITGGGTWALAKRADADANSHAEIWYAPNVSGGVTSLTVTSSFGGTDAQMEIDVLEFRNVLTVSPLDVAPTVTTGSSATPTITTGALAQADEVIVMVNCHSGADLTTMVEDSGDGYTEISQNLDNDLGQGYESMFKIATATTTHAVTCTYNASRAWAACLASFKGLAPAGGTSLLKMLQQN